MSVFDAVNKFFGVASGSGRKKRMDEAISRAEQGKKSPGATFGNPAGDPKKRKKKKN
jgi:hypothetical protein